MRVCGVIAEYDPFHNGHLYHAGEARRRSGADFMVCALGCAFSQRGDPMLFSTRDRARMALMNGFDLVLGMPVSFSCAQANRFAAGGVGVLRGIGAVTDLSFGCETDRADWLWDTARFLNHPDAAYVRRLREGLDAGKPFAAAQGGALAQALPGIPEKLLRSPNFILGVSYLREVLRRNLTINVWPVLRETDYHSQALSKIASASAVRARLLTGDIEEALGACPAATAEVVREAIDDGRVHRPGALDAALIARLLETSEDSLRRSPEVSEGLERRILAAARESSGREELVGAVKTRRYLRSRVSRALSHALTGLSDFPPHPPYARLLGFRRGAKPLLAALDQHFPLVGRPARSRDPGVAQDMRAEELWALGSGQAPAAPWREQVVIID